MSSTDHLLTKTRFKIGLECPTKLYYLSQEYPSSKDKNEFLQVHADGGHQVGEYAKFVIQAKYPTHQFEEGREFVFPSRKPFFTKLRLTSKCTLFTINSEFLKICSIRRSDFTTQSRKFPRGPLLFDL